MINPIHNHRMLPSTSSAFIEGASSPENKIAAFVMGVFISLASFFLFPAEGALIVSAGAVALISFCNCLPGGPAAEGEERRWYHRIIQEVPAFFHQNVVPVRNPGPRVPVGGQRYYQPAPVGRGPRQGGIPEEGWVRPVIHPEPPNPDLAPPPQGRVPVGHGHRRL